MPLCPGPDVPTTVLAPASFSGSYVFTAAQPGSLYLFCSVSGHCTTVRSHATLYPVVWPGSHTGPVRVTLQGSHTVYLKCAFPVGKLFIPRTKKHSDDLEPWGPTWVQHDHMHINS